MEQQISQGGKSNNFHNDISEWDNLLLTMVNNDLTDAYFIIREEKSI